MGLGTLRRYYENQGASQAAPSAEPADFRAAYAEAQKRIGELEHELAVLKAASASTVIEVSVSTPEGVSPEDVAEAAAGAVEDAPAVARRRGSR